MSPLGWLETNVVQFVNPNHIWADPSGRTFHLWMRAHTGGTGYAAIAKVVETGPVAGEGAMHMMLEQVPSGEEIAFIPCPGGQMKFHISYDEEDGLFWLLSTQATDSMTRQRAPPAAVALFAQHGRLVFRWDGGGRGGRAGIPSLCQYGHRW